MIIQKKRGQRIILLTLLGLSILGEDFQAHAQSGSFESLPEDIVFTIGTWHRPANEWPGSGATAATLGLLDASTLEIQEIYTAPRATEVRPLKWSPDGEMLAVVQIYDQEHELFIKHNYDRNAAPAQICIINVQGDLQICFDQLPPVYWYTAPGLVDYEYHVTWSTDSSAVLFVTEQNQLRQLIEVEIATGQTRRVVYEMPSSDDNGYINTMLWLDKLDYLLVGAGFTDRSGMIVNLETGQKYSLENLEQKIDGVASDSLGSIELVCNRFSNTGRHLTAITESQQLVIFTPEFSLVHVIGLDDKPHGVFCPEWGLNDDSLFFVAEYLQGDPVILHTYSLVNQKFLGRIATPRLSIFSVASDDSHMIFESLYSFYIYHPNNSWLEFANLPDQFYANPLWRRSMN